MSGGVVVLYHKGCLDGFTVAWVFWCKYRDSAKYILVSYHDAPSWKHMENKEVYMLDFAYDYTTMVIASTKAKKFVVLDHHKTAIPLLELIESEVFEGIIDKSRSGVMIAWDFLHPTEAPPTLLELVQDYDLWKFEFELTKPATAALKLGDKEFANWAQLMCGNLEYLVTIGSLLVEVGKRIVKSICSLQCEAFLDSYKVPVVNCPREFINEVGNELCKGKYFSAVYNVVAMEVFFSLRSNKETKGFADVANVAESFVGGGGGYENLAGFVVGLDFLKQLEWHENK